MNKIKQHQEISAFCEKYKNENEFNPAIMEEYNKKFRKEFYAFLDNGNYDADVVAFYKFND